MSSDYRLAPALRARLLGFAAILASFVVLAATGLVAGLDGPPWVVMVVGVVVVLAIAALAVATRRVPVLRVDDGGYRVRWVRGVGAAAGRWRDVEQAAAASPRGVDCVILRRQDGLTTSIPVAAIGTDRDQLVVEIRQHLTRGEGLRPL